jgi:hypothetical protein
MVRMKKIRFFIISIFFLFFSLYPASWINPGKEAVYLFAPGIHAAERHVAQYCQAYRASTGQLVCADNDFTVLGTSVQPVIFPEIIEHATEVEPFKPAHLFSWQKLLGHLYHSISVKRLKTNERTNKLTVEKNENNEKDASKHAVRLSALNLAQEEDIETLSATYNELLAFQPGKYIVLYGVSRGAATAFNFLATEYIKKEIKHIKAVVLEGCFDSVKNILHNKFKFAQNYPKLQQVIQKIFGSIYTGHDLEGIAPIKLVEQFPHDIPVLFITSKIDTVVPHQCTWNLYRALKKTGHPNAFLLELKHSSHPHYMIENEYDRDYYQAAVHAFYKKFGLPYDPDKIPLGEVVLAQCQPE